MDNYDQFKDVVSSISVLDSIEDDVDADRQWTSELPPCPYCINLVHQAFRDGPKSREYMVQLVLQWPKLTLADVRSSASGRCQSCALLNQVIDDFGKLSDVQQKLGSSCKTSNPTVQVELGKAVFGGPPRLSLQLWFDSGKKSKRSYVHEVMHLSGTSNDSDSSGALVQSTAYDIPGHFGDQGCFDFVAMCLKECIEKHSTQSESLPILPTRVLEITNTNSIKLLEPRGRRDRYVTLSHRWSNAVKEQKRTLRNNVQQHQLGIDPTELSTVFRDAVVLTNALGIKFLWIDSLCIMQDDVDDWIRESSKMSSIYGQSTLTIFATSTAGCFIPREGFEKRKYRYATPQGQTIELLAHSAVRHSHTERPFRSVTASSLFKRGWAFQEWLISSRAIVFGPDELLWSCDHAVRCECSLVSRDPHTVASSDVWQNLLHTRNAFRLGTRQGRVGRLNLAWAKHEEWLLLAQMYSATRLTLETDRLPALSGLAKQFWTAQGNIIAQSLDDYLAGCWRPHLIPSLLWYSMPPRRSDDPKFIDMTRTGYIAPSWSWLSLPYYVKFTYAMSRWLWENPSTAREFVRVEHAHCRRATEDPTGALKSGHITVCGPTFEASLVAIPYAKHNLELQLGFWRAEVCGDYGSVPFSRLFPCDSKPARVTCLLVQGLLDSQPNTLRYCEIGLILASTEQMGYYERVGLFDFDHLVHDKKHPTDSWCSVLGMTHSNGTESTNIDFFLRKLLAQGTSLPDTIHSVLPRTTPRRITIV